MKTLFCAQEMQSVHCGYTPAGWYGTGLVLVDLDKPYLDQIEAVFFLEKGFPTEGKPFDDYFEQSSRLAEKSAEMPADWVGGVRHTKRRLDMRMRRTDREHGRIDLVVHDLETGSEAFISRNELNIHAHAAALGGGIYIAYEAKPSWGANHSLT